MLACIVVAKGAHTLTMAKNMQEKQCKSDKAQRMMDCQVQNTVMQFWALTGVFRMQMEVLLKKE